MWTAEYPAYMDHFTPDSGWAKCAGADTPGAVDCQGNRLGLGVIEPFSEFAENDGFGWDGQVTCVMRSMSRRLRVMLTRWH